jgi:putative hydrolase of the HAD superfamily
MDNEFSLNDIACLSEFIHIALTSVDVGFRKPNKTGFHRLAAALGAGSDEMLFVGDEEKDIRGAKNAGIRSVLINRSENVYDFGQDHTIHSLGELSDILPYYQGAADEHRS